MPAESICSRFCRSFKRCSRKVANRGVAEDGNQGRGGVEALRGSRAIKIFLMEVAKMTGSLSQGEQESVKSYMDKAGSPTQLKRAIQKTIQLAGRKN